MALSRGRQHVLNQNGLAAAVIAQVMDSSLCHQLDTVRKFSIIQRRCPLAVTVPAHHDWFHRKSQHQLINHNRIVHFSSFTSLLLVLFVSRCFQQRSLCFFSLSFFFLNSALSFQPIFVPRCEDCQRGSGNGRVGDVCRSVPPPPSPPLC